MTCEKLRVAPLLPPYAGLGLVGMGRPRETGTVGRLSRLQLAYAAGVPEATVRSLEARGVIPETRIPGSRSAPL
jgi:hypothetical protein